MKNMKKISSMLISILMSTLLISCYNEKKEINLIEIKEDVKEEEKDIDIEYSINFFGDLLIHKPVYNAAKSGDTYDFTSQFIEIADKVKDADFSIGNMEVPLGSGSNNNFSGYPSFLAPSQLATALKNTLDVELLTTATNHSLDRGFKGLTDTIDVLDKAEIDHIGTYKDEESSNEIYIKEIEGGIKIAILNYTYGTNGIPIPKDKPYSINIIDKNKIKLDSDKAKRLGADFIIAKLHWGEEYKRLESGYGEKIALSDFLDIEKYKNVKENTKTQRGLAKYIFENTDISLIVGDHPHVVQNIEQMEVLKDGEEKTGVVVYSLGNFISNQTDLLTNSGIIAKVNLYINKTNPKETKVTSIEYTPIYVDRNLNSSENRYRVLDIKKAIADYEEKKDKYIDKKEYDDLIFARDYYRDKLVFKDFVFEN